MPRPRSAHLTSMRQSRPPWAEAVAGLTQLRVLNLEGAYVPGESDEEAPAVPPLENGAIWGYLHALCWACNTPLPQASASTVPLDCCFCACNLLMQLRPGASKWRCAVCLRQP